MKRTYLLFLIIGLITFKSVQSLKCDAISQCKCQMSDGSGVVNLNGINLKANNDPKWAVEDPGYYWTYSYNPCKGFSFSYDRYNDDGTTTQVNYADLAVLQSAYSEGYDLGVQSTEFFNYSDASGLNVHYVAGDGVRKSRVNLICNRGIPAHLFYYIGELIITEYLAKFDIVYQHYSLEDFILEGPCACPNGCNDEGIIQNVPAPTNNDDTFKWKTVSFDLVSLLLHDLILVFIIGCTAFVLSFFFGISCMPGKAAGLSNVNYSSNA